MCSQGCLVGLVLSIQLLGDAEATFFYFDHGPLLEQCVMGPVVPNQLLDVVGATYVSAILLLARTLCVADPAQTLELAYSMVLVRACYAHPVDGCCRRTVSVLGWILYLRAADGLSSKPAWWC